jgi:hypothetical protein
LGLELAVSPIPKAALADNGACAADPGASSKNCDASSTLNNGSSNRALTCGSSGGVETSRGAPSSGLVYLATKDTCIALDADRRRLSRMRRGVVSAAKLVQEEMQEGGQRYRVAFITVTYRPGQHWDAGDVRALVKHYRHWGQRRGVKLGIIWVAETHGGGGTNHGQIHYHLVIFVPRGLTPPMPDKQGWWRKGMSNCKWAHSPVGYLAKYTSKGLDSPPMPPGARLWGVSGLTATVRTRLIYALAPKWLQQFCQPGEIVKRIAHGWWRNCTTGWEYRTPWEFELRADGSRLKWRGWTEYDVEYKPA